MGQRVILVAAALGMLLTTGPARAANPQQDKMKACNAEATQKALKGDARKTFMKTCLSAGGESAPAANTQQAKMKTCNKIAGEKGLKGDARKTFMSSCLSGK